MAESRNVAVADDFEVIMRPKAQRYGGQDASEHDGNVNPKLVSILRHIQTSFPSLTPLESQDAQPTGMANNRSPVRWRSTANKSDASSNSTIMHDHDTSENQTKR